MKSRDIAGDNLGAAAVATRSQVRRITRFTKSDALRARVHDFIPGGAHTYSKGDDQFPERSPGFIVRGKGCFCWDVDGNRYIDYGMGLRSVLLGHAYEPVLKAVRRELRNGTNFTRPSPNELELATLLRDVLPVADMSKFAKNGSTVNTAAVKLARAYTGRDLVARCAQHPFFSYDDWFIGTTACESGVPKPISDLTLLFDFNDAAALERLFDEHSGRIACVVLEPATGDAEPAAGYLQRVRELCTRHGAVLIFDEMITGFRWHVRGAAASYGVLPDLATYGKGIANGFSLTALTGRREIMELGGIRHARDRVFLISTTHGAETLAIAATLASVAIVRDHDVPAHLWRVGRVLLDGLNGAARERGLEPFLTFSGVPCSPLFACRDRSGQISMAFRTLLLQELIARGILMPFIALSYSHGEEHVAETVEAFRDCLDTYEAALEQGVDKYLVGPPIKPVFRRRN